jgi:hypothetical protein
MMALKSLTPLSLTRTRPGPGPLAGRAGPMRRSLRLLLRGSPHVAAAAPRCRPVEDQKLGRCCWRQAEAGGRRLAACSAPQTRRRARMRSAPPPVAGSGGCGDDGDSVPAGRGLGPGRPTAARSVAQRSGREVGGTPRPQGRDKLVVAWPRLHLTGAAGSILCEVAASTALRICTVKSQAPAGFCRCLQDDPHSSVFRRSCTRCCSLLKQISQRLCHGVTAALSRRHDGAVTASRRCCHGVMAALSR